MERPDESHVTCSVTLSVPVELRWTLHHVLLDRIEQETTATRPENVNPPPIEVFQAFEIIDAGDSCFTIAQLEAIQETLADYHHSETWWEIERSHLEQLLHRVSNHIDHQTAPQVTD